MSIAERIKELVSGAKELPVDVPYEVRWKCYASNGWSTVGVPRVEVFPSKEAAVQYSNALYEAMKFLQGDFWESPVVSKKGK